MGKIFDEFGSLTYENEADVNQNFVIPLLTKYLGFHQDEIKPERLFPAFGVPTGRRETCSEKLPDFIKPDYIVCIEDETNPKFIVETKAVTEKLENHTPQVRSYATGVGVNFILSTNGEELQIFDANLPIFKVESIAELDIKFNLVKSILSRDSFLAKEPIEIIQSIDYDRALNRSLKEKSEAEIKKKQLKISDFREYLINVREKTSIWQKPLIFQFDPEFQIEHFSPERLLKFKLFIPSQSEFEHLHDDETYVISDLDNKLKSKMIILIGESGIGKTTSLKYLTWLKSTKCIDIQSTQIPIYIQLRYYGLNHSLEDLAIKYLAENGFSISNSEYREYLNKNEFTFLLDAFDEIPEQFVKDFQEELMHFSETFNHKIIITTRQLRIPKIQNSRNLLISPLDNSMVEEFLKIYLKNHWQDLHNQIKLKNLERESQNTLMLTFIIWIYQDFYELPHSRPQIIKIIVEKIKEWEDSKMNRFSYTLPWEIKEELLSALAFESAKNEKSIINSEDFFNITTPVLEEYVNQKKIPQSYLRSDIINNLEVTGIIEENNGEFSFWHRAFLEYFASIEFAKQFQSNSGILHEYNGKISWENILLGASGFLTDSTDFILGIKEKNIYLSALCVCESKNIDQFLVEKIRSVLINLCNSPIIERRQRGIFLLSKIEQKYPSDYFYRILNENKHHDIRQRALETIAKSRTPKAKEKVNELYYWDGPSQYFITGETIQGTIAKALSNFGEEEHLKILEIWGSHTDLPTRISCRDALIDVVREGRLSDKVKNALVAFYYQNLEKEDFHVDTLFSSLFVEINDEEFVLDLIKKIPLISEDKRIHLDGLDEILAGCTSKNVKEELICIVSSSSNSFLREECAGALRKTSEPIPIEIYINMIQDEDPIVRRNAILGLDKFPDYQIKDLLINSIEDKNFIVQSTVIKKLAERGFLIEVIKDRHLPKGYFSDSVVTLLQEIRKYGLKDLIPHLSVLKDKISDEQLLVDFSLTYYILGDFDTSKQIIESYYVDEKFVFKEYGLYQLIKIAPNFEYGYAFSIINRAWNTIDKSEDKTHSLEHLCITSLGQIPSEESISFLKDKAVLYAENKSNLIIEETFRALNKISSEDDEDWYIQYIRDYAPFDNCDYHRIIEGLGKIGTDKSELLIKEISNEYKDNEYILNICYFSLEWIKSKSGNFFTINEDDLLS